jgi:hypothetical protein
MRATLASAAVAHSPQEAQFPVIPVELGNFSILPGKCGFCTENSGQDQSLASQFP